MGVMNMAEDVYAVIHFTDGSDIKLQWQRQAGEDSTTISRNVRNALEADKVVAKVDESLMIVPMQNVKYVVITPAPSELPQTVLKNAHIVS